MAAIAPFTPGPTVLLNVGTVASSALIEPHASVLYLLNMGAELVFVKIGTGTIRAKISDFPILPKIPVLLSKTAEADTISAISLAAGPSVLYVTAGAGGL